MVRAASAGDIGLLSYSDRRDGGGSYTLPSDWFGNIGIARGWCGQHDSLVNSLLAACSDSLDIEFDNAESEQLGANCRL